MLAPEQKTRSLPLVTITGPVRRYELPNVLALKFVLDGALGGGAARSLRSDNLGKTLASALLRLDIEVDA